MTSPVSPKFATEEDVADRFEGVFPSARLDWVTVRITDVENALMGSVPSLRKPLSEIIDESEQIGDPLRVQRVVTLVCNKVLQLYRNPDGANQRLRTIDDVTDSRSYYQNAPGGGIEFTEYELASVRLKKRSRPRFGMIPVAPWRITT